MNRIFDRKGQEIHVGDRIKLVAEACNKHLHDYYGEYWRPEMYVDKDMYGTVSDDDFLQVVADNGAMLLPLNWLKDGDSEPLVEVVTSG